ncbi:MAG: Ig-like domain-containing protein [Clostridia bacterium]|nr:Ig-like domain-containing protein [Clostridia bacterium]
MNGKTIKRITALILTLALMLCANAAAFAANGFQYRHDPRENAAAMRDIVADKSAVYGFRPSETGSLKLYADADWSDPEIVSQGRADRIAYHESVQSMYVMLNEMREHGKSVEEIARAVSTRRNEIRMEAYADDPEGLAALKARNLEKYGHEEGPLPDELYAQYGSWERVMEKSFSTNAGMDACLGLYDDYYFLYVALGDVPADVVISLPDEVTCGRGKTKVLDAVIVTNAAEYTVRFESDDEKIARVDENGAVTGVRIGETAVRCIVTDAAGYEHISEPCRVSVRSNFVLWLTRILTFFKDLFHMG